MKNQLEVTGKNDCLQSFKLRVEVVARIFMDFLVSCLLGVFCLFEGSNGLSTSAWLRKRPLTRRTPSKSSTSTCSCGKSFMSFGQKGSKGNGFGEIAVLIIVAFIVAVLL